MNKKLQLEGCSFNEINIEYKCYHILYFIIY